MRGVTLSRAKHIEAVTAEDGIALVAPQRKASVKVIECLVALLVGAPA